MSEENCLFCKIIKGEIPGAFVHHDARCVVIRDIHPQAPMPVLVLAVGVAVFFLLSAFVVIHHSRKNDGDAATPPPEARSVGS